MKKTCLLWLSLLLLVACQNDDQLPNAEPNKKTLSTDTNVEKNSDKGDKTQPSKYDLWAAGVNTYGEKIQINDKTDDLSFLEEVLKDKRIVYLGESSHFQTEFNQVKYKIIKYLHEELGYNVLAFESGLAETNGVYFNQENLSPKEMLEKSLYPVWYDKENIELFEYIKKQKNNSNPLHLTGFDMKPPSNEVDEEALEVYKKWIGAIDVELAENFIESEKQYMSVIPSAPSEVFNKTEETEQLVTQYRNLLNNLKDKQQQFEDEKQFLLVRTIIQNRIEVLDKNFYKYWTQTNSQKDINESYRIRDEMMAENLKWIIEELYPNEKIIVWAHNVHIRKFNSGAEVYTSNFPSIPMMGEILEEEYGEESYTLGLFFKEGSAKYHRDGKELPFKPVQKGSLEWTISQGEGEATFIDFTNIPNNDETSWAREEMNIYINGKFTQKIIPTEQYDGVIGLDEVSPIEFID